MMEVLLYSMYAYFALWPVQGSLYLMRKRGDGWALAYARMARLMHAFFWVLAVGYVARMIWAAYADLMKAIEQGNVVLAKEELKEFLYAVGFAFLMAFWGSMVLQSHLRDLSGSRRRTSVVRRGQELGAEDTLYGSCDV